MITIDSICRIGAEYLNGRYRNIKALEDSVKFVEKNGMPSVRQLVEAIRGIPKCENGWMLWSEDKRWQPAWYFVDGEDGDYYVGHYSTKHGKKHECRFSDKAEACAFFVKKEIEDYARILRSSTPNK